MKYTVRTAKVLPKIVRDKLRAALEIHPGVEPGCSLERTRELDRVTHHAKMHFPQYFQKDQP